MFSRFKYFFTESQDNPFADLKKSLLKIPASHRKLMRGYKYAFEKGNTLKGDSDHIGFNDLRHKSIKIAAPWNYGREFAFLHEVGHSVWLHYIEHSPKLKKEWESIVKKTKDKVDQNIEEIFCHAYASTYCKNKIEVHNHKEWEAFVKKIN